MEGEAYDAYRSGDDEKARVGYPWLVGQGKPAKKAYDLFDIGAYPAVLVFAPRIPDASPVMKCVPMKVFVILPQTSSIPILEENALEDTTGRVHKNYSIHWG